MNRDTRTDRRPPVETSRPVLVSTLHRSPTEELRFVVAEVEGHRFVRVERWDRGRDGWARVGQGITIRAREVGRAIDALRAAIPLLDGPQKAPSNAAHSPSKGRR